MVDDLNNRFRGLLLWREFQHDLSAANCDILLIESIESLLAFIARIHQTRLAQNGEMMRDGGLRDVHLLDDLIH